MNRFSYSDEFMVEQPCPKCGKMVKRKVTGFELNANYGIIGAHHCDSCQKEFDREDQARMKFYDHSKAKCPSCHGSRKVNGYTCGLCLGTGLV